MKRAFLRTARIAISSSLICASAAPLWGWKVVTHAHLAFIARADALDDGKVTIHLVDHDAGRPVLDAAGRPVEIGRYDVDPRILRVLRLHPRHFRAGVIGTDVLPDFLTAQTIVHPDNRGLGRTVSDEWLDLVWTEALRDRSDQALAFALGYLAHGAGDLFGHTFVNEYAGGPFDLGANALKHFVLENYIDLRTPREPGFFDISIDGIEAFLHRTLVVNERIWRPGRDSILSADMINSSLPRVFLSLKDTLLEFLADARASLQRADKDYPARVRALQREAAACLKSDPAKSAKLAAEASALGAEYAALKAARAAEIAYLSAWIKDIDSGLRAWPAFGRRLAETVFFCPEADKDAAMDAAEDFMNAHGWSMCGVPDVVGGMLAEQKRIYEKIPKRIRDLIELFQTDPVLFMLEKAWGLTWDLVKNPAVHFDEIENAGPGRRTTLAQFNREALRIDDIGNTTDATYDWRDIPAMVNTVTMTKLSWLGPGGLRALLQDLEDYGYASNAAAPLMVAPDGNRPPILGFMKSLDFDNQWCEEPRLLFARDPCAFRRLFLRQIGEDEPGCLTACDTPPDGSVVAAAVESPLAAGFREYDLAMRADGSIVQWGKEFILTMNNGQGYFREFASPEVKAGAPPAAAVYVHSPEDRVIVLARDGTVWTWGFGAHGDSGLFDTPDKFEPRRIPNLLSIVQIAVGTRHALALRSNGQVWAWGANNGGVLGLGAKISPARPRRVSGLGGIVRVAAGDYFSLALTSEGHVWAWGRNDAFQLGDRLKEERYAPVRIAGLEGVRNAAAGYAHVLVLKGDGSVWTWGKNNAGQLGDGGTADRPNPAPVPGLKGIVAVAAGNFQSVALDRTGSVWAWGDHFMDLSPVRGAARRSAVPVKVPGLPPIVAVACGQHHALALDGDGSVWTWGANVSARRPVKIPGFDLE